MEVLHSCYLDEDKTKIIPKHHHPERSIIDILYAFCVFLYAVCIQFLPCLFTDYLGSIFSC